MSTTILSDYAKSYLRNNPEEWHTFISSLAEVLSESAAIEPVDFFSTQKYQLSSKVIESIIMEKFMSPAVAHLVSGLNNEIPK